LLFFLCTLWATRSVVHKSTGAFVGLSQVDGFDPVGAIVHGIDAVLVGGRRAIGSPRRALLMRQGRFLKLMKPSRSTLRT